MEVYPVQVIFCTLVFLSFFFFPFLFSSLVRWGVGFDRNSSSPFTHTSPHPSGAQTLGREMKFQPLNEELLCFYFYFFCSFLVNYLLLSWGRVKKQGREWWLKKNKNEDVCVVLSDRDECFLFEFTTKCGEKITMNLLVKIFLCLFFFLATVSSFFLHVHTMVYSARFYLFFSHTNTRDNSHVRWWQWNCWQNLLRS